MSNVFYAARRISREEVEAPAINKGSDPATVIILIVACILIFWLGGKISNWLDKY